MKYVLKSKSWLGRDIFYAGVGDWGELHRAVRFTSVEHASIFLKETLWNDVTIVDVDEYVHKDKLGDNAWLT